MLSEDEVARVAYLARLSITADETRQLAQQLSTILSAFERIAKVDTAGIEPLVTPTDVHGFWRTDEVLPWEGAEAALGNAPETVGNLFKVPPVVG